MEARDLWRRSKNRTLASSGVVISSRIRLARNMEGEVFPDRCAEKDRLRIWEAVHPVLTGREGLAPALALHMGALDELDKQMLLERHLISREQTVRGPGSGLVTCIDEGAGVMVNEEDHLRLQVLQPGLALREAWERANELDSSIERDIPYAFSARYGYLTACPTNVGTGLRASVMLHLPALSLLEEIGPVVKGLGKIGLAVRGLWGEGTEAHGHLFQISNQVTLGETEAHMIAHLQQVVEELAGHETNARHRLMEQHPRRLRDHVGRAHGVLSRAHLLSSKEAMALLSGLRLGMETGILEMSSKEAVNMLLIQVLPAHLQHRAGRRLDSEARDGHRADLIRRTLGRLEQGKKKDE